MVLVAVADEDDIRVDIVDACVGVRVGCEEWVDEVGCGCSEVGDGANRNDDTEEVG